MNKHCWLPYLEYFEKYKGLWSEYQEMLYSIFKHDFIDTQPCFEEKRVNIRRHPIEFGKEEAFFHITSQDYNKNGERLPDLRRCERIRWTRAFIENQCSPKICNNCEGIKTWKELYHGSERVHILLEEERYMVVLELRKSYCLLITAFYIEHDHALSKQLKHYEQYKTE